LFFWSWWKDAYLDTHPLICHCALCRCTDVCHIVVQSYINTLEPETCDPWNIGFVLANGDTVWNASMCWDVYGSFGVTVFTIDDSKCTVIRRRTYHTSELPSEAWALASDLMQATDGSWLIGVTGNDATNQLAQALPTLFSFGVYVGDVEYRGSFVFAIKKGDLGKTMLNKTKDNTEQPARLDIVISGTHALCDKYSLSLWSWAVA